MLRRDSLHPTPAALALALLALAGCEARPALPEVVSLGQLKQGLTCGAAMTACPATGDGYWCGNGSCSNAGGACCTCSLAAHCGTDCVACSTTGASSTSCTGATPAQSFPASQSCKPVCLAARKDLDGDASNGCEPCDRPAGCGSNCLACPTITGATPTGCTGNIAVGALACLYTCDAGYRKTGIDDTAPCTQELSHK